MKKLIHNISRAIAWRSTWLFLATLLCLSGVAKPAHADAWEAGQFTANDIYSESAGQYHYPGTGWTFWAYTTSMGEPIFNLWAFDTDVHKNDDGWEIGIEYDALYIEWQVHLDNLAGTVIETETGLLAHIQPPASYAGHTFYVTCNMSNPWPVGNDRYDHFVDGASYQIGYYGASGAVPTDQPTQAPLDGDPVDPHTGIEQRTEAPDLVVHNPNGPDAVFQRQFSTYQAANGVSDAGMNAGWHVLLSGGGSSPSSGGRPSSDWDFWIEEVHNGDSPVEPTIWYLCYPNGARKLLWIDQPECAHANTDPPGAPVPSTSGAWPPIVDPRKWNFASGMISAVDIDGTSTTFSAVGTSNIYRLTTYTDRMGHSIQYNYDSSNRLSSISGGGNTLLTVSYDPTSYRLASVTDAMSSRTVYYSQVAEDGTGDLMDQVSQINAPGSSRIQYHYNTDGLLDRVYTPPMSGSQNSKYEITYEASSPGGAFSPLFHRVCQTKDPNGFIRHYTYDTDITIGTGGSAFTRHGTHVEVKDASGTVKRSFLEKFDPATGFYTGRVENGRETLIEYGTNGYDATNPVHVKDANGHDTYYTWDQNQNLLSAKWPNNTTGGGNTATKYTYNYSDTLGFPYIKTVSVATGDANVVLGTGSGSQLIPTLYHFNPSTAIDTTQQSGSYVYKYDSSFNMTADRGLLTSIDTPRPGAVYGDSNPTVTTTLTYDSLGDVATVTVPASSGTVTAKFTYKNGSPPPSRGCPLTSSVPVSSTFNRVTNFTWNTNGTLATVKDANNNTTAFTYDAAKALATVTYPLTSGSGYAAYVAYVRQIVGGPAKEVQAYGEGSSASRGYTAHTTYNFGLAGELTGVGGDTEPVTFGHTDPNYRLTSLADGKSNSTSFSFADGDASNSTTATFPEAIHHSSPFDVSSAGEARTVSASTVSAPYSPAVTATDGNNISYTSHFDGPNGELTSVDYPGTDDDLHYEYDIYDRVMHVWHGAGDTIYNASTSYKDKTDYTYDDLGLVHTVTTSYNKSYGASPAISKTITYAYYPNGRRQSMVVSALPTSLNTYTYTYNLDGSLAAMTSPFSGTSSWAYYNNGWLTEQNIAGGVNSGGVTTDYYRNARGLPVTIDNEVGHETDPNSGNPYSIYAYFSGLTYDALGNRTYESAYYGTPPSSSYATYYNGNTTFTYSGGAGKPYGLLYREQSTRENTWDLSYVYDAAFNPTTFHNVAGLSYNGDNQRMGPDANADHDNNPATNPTWFYDGNGNPTVYGGTPLAYDVNSHLTGITGFGFSAGYDAFGRRAWKQVSGVTTYYLYDGMNPVAEMTSTGSFKAVNEFGANGLIARYASASGGLLLFTFDASGNNAITKLVGTQNLYNDYAFENWGLQGYVSPFGFGGQYGYYTDESGLTLCGQRYYDAGSGRFLTRDPAGYAGGINLYAYCKNNPVNMVDPSGLCPDDVAGTDNDPLIRRYIDGTDDWMRRVKRVAPLLNEAVQGTNNALDATAGLGGGGGGGEGPSEGPGDAGGDVGGKGGEAGGEDATDVFVRRGTDPETAEDLGNQAARAKDTGKFPHGVSVTSPDGNLRTSARLGYDPTDSVTATRGDLAEAGFDVQHTPTRYDPSHHTVVLPEPVTEEIANLFNQIFGRG